MGLGKTFLMLAHILVSKDTEPVAPRSTFCGATLLVLPLSLLQGWEKEIEDSIEPERLKFLTYHAANIKQNTKIEDLKSQDLVIVTYDTLQKDSTTNGPLSKICWKRLVLDEGHEAINVKSKKTQAIMKISAERTVIMTGTVFINSPKDFGTFLAITNLCKPLNVDKDFKKYITTKLNSEDEEKRFAAESLLQSVVRQTTLRRTKDMMVDDHRPLVPLPPIDVRDVAVSLSPEVQKGYNEILELVQTRIVQLSAPGTIHEIPRLFLSAITYLRLYCLDPSLVKANWVKTLRSDVESRSQAQTVLFTEQATTVHKVLKGSSFFDPTTEEALEDTTPMTVEDDDAEPELSAKIQALVNQLDAFPSGDKILVFSQFTRFLTRIERILTRRGIPSLRLDGSQTDAQRRTTLKRFDVVDTDNAKKWPEAHPRVLLLSLKAGACGLNLTVANHVIFMDPWWQSAIIQQATDRIRRLGQTKPMTVHHLLAAGTIEERVRYVSAHKQKISDDAFSWIKTPVLKEEAEAARISDALKALGL
ncbi:P-loop containing nucleoside triphosphate hydrolase protein [Exidia glandulosa HHB12029]|uniref:p-loop containing nucleoside triphosphate hydrolase protein n=1 Tax=Exidia glandulosa HHB12029 TaxID=1314781 RepID=A0A165I0W7_EXIGL|nr:P-loop containing nucleoside triphosphate hydrolase protein [Exidia glandulosa HHB12029]